MPRFIDGWQQRVRSALAVGRGGNNGALNVSGSGVVNNTGGNITIGAFGGNRGAVTVSNSGVLNSNPGSVFVGESGVGTLTLNDTGSVSAKAPAMSGRIVCASSRRWRSRPTQSPGISMLEPAFLMRWGPLCYRR